ncbi:hypothetical protein FHS29_002205 [Saccharothrix tamanrassetensis]|uniref:Uncharacterized protein n=1 Tax=Saccharothrix tamanrassetensis TaxID=1051531 RepID=A0A841CGY4_9PSEU|nr:hypothetical protein [Saccharothrix tamanrassetensis]MBB5955624.1 hypothetical protein [Saccharothrix tamanrassetensis]
MTKTWHRPTLRVAGAMAVLTLVTLGGLLFDGRVLQGAPLWLKPFKFAVSLAVYSATLSWMLSLPHKGKRWTSGLATLIATVLLVDVALVAIQAARGTFSHYNTDDDTWNQVVQFMFQYSIPLMFLANVVLAVILSFQRLTAGNSRSVTWAVRTGLSLAIAGMAVGYLMIFQFDKHVETTDAAGRAVELRGGHSVGVPDGGDGLPVTAWSTTGGDLRIPHFVGMHGLQVMILLALGLTAVALHERTRLRLVLIAATGYSGLLALLTWQALRGEPLIHPSTTTLAVFGCLAVAVATAVGWTITADRAAPAPVRQPVPRR